MARAPMVWGYASGYAVAPYGVGYLHLQDHPPRERERSFVRWYNPKTKSPEDVPAPSTDEEALQMLSGDPKTGR